MQSKDPMMKITDQLLADHQCLLSFLIFTLRAAILIAFIVLQIVSKRSDEVFLVSFVCL